MIVNPDKTQNRRKALGKRKKQQQPTENQKYIEYQNRN